MNTIPPYIKMFPETVDVFADRIEEHSNFLFPLFSIELSAINPSWNGKIYMLQFNEDPYNRNRISAFNNYCKDYMIGFDIKDGKYSFKTDFKFFELSPDWLKYFEETKNSFNKTRTFYQNNGKLPDKSYGKSDPYEQIGGEPVWIQGGEGFAPLDPEGNSMEFIARVDSSNYTDDSCPKDIYL